MGKTVARLPIPLLAYAGAVVAGGRGVWPRAVEGLIGDGSGTAFPPRRNSSGASIYPAVENMLLAARALGLGSTLTTRHIGYAKECDEAMGIPPNYHSYAILPIGYPMGRFGPVGRGPLSEVVYLDGWGKPYPGV
ncbi:MAG TPA: nitroreductase family protein [Stellaceae bacterium]